MRSTCSLVEIHNKKELKLDRLKRQNRFILIKMIDLTSFVGLAKFSIYNLLQLTKVIQDPIIYHRLPIDLFPFFREKKV